MPAHVLRATVEHERNDQDVHGREAVFVNKPPVDKVKLNQKQKR